MLVHYGRAASGADAHGSEILSIISDVVARGAGGWRASGSFLFGRDGEGALGA
jgi:hypothetical protein